MKIIDYVIEARPACGWSAVDEYALLSEARQEIKWYRKNGMFKKYRIVKRVTVTKTTKTVIK